VAQHFSIDEAIRTAIAEKRLVSFDLDGLPRPRPAPSGRHKHWDALIASVSQRSEP
jgi:hypothetical protein